MANNHRDVTVIIPTRNRPRALGRVFRTYLESTSVSALVIVNDASEVSYDAVVTEMARECQERRVTFQYIHLTQHRGAPYARQLALQQVHTRYVLFGDDDVMVSSGYADVLRSVVSQASGPCIAGGSGVYLDAAGRAKHDPSPLFNPLLLVGNPSAVRGTQSVPFVHTFSVWDKQRTFDRGVHFYTGYVGNGYREETDPQLQVRSRGLGDIVITDRVQYTHLSYAHVERGGQRSMNTCMYELYTILNECIFMHRHAAYFIRTRGAWFIPVHLAAFVVWRCVRGALRTLAAYWRKMPW